MASGRSRQPSARTALKSKRQAAGGSSSVPGINDPVAELTDRWLAGSGGDGPLAKAAIDRILRVFGPQPDGWMSFDPKGKIEIHRATSRNLETGYWVAEDSGVKVTGLGTPMFALFAGLPVADEKARSFKSFGNCSFAGLTLSLHRRRGCQIALISSGNITTRHPGFRFAMKEGLLARPSTDNVDTKSPDRTRVSVFRTLLGICIDDVDDGLSDEYKENALSFLLHVGWHEGARLKARVQGGNGPARSFFQFEAYRAKEALAYATHLGYLETLAGIVGVDQTDLTDAGDELPSFDDPDCSRFPKGNLIEKYLLEKDLFGIYLARIAFRKIPAAIPPDNAGHASYWFRYWKGGTDDPDDLQGTFRDEANEVDQLIS